ncbi:hypothetical protein IL306_009438 [Fusarium sp. DS 682]|nr:hypothetical protein IL306_009438 [Fusarium sp. DS 682]
MGSLKPLRLPTPRTSKAGAPRLATDASNNKPYRDRIYKSQHLDRLLTLSCHTRGIRPLLLSAFYEPRIECNAVTPWLQGTLAAIKHVAVEDVDIEVRVHQQCEDHWLQYEGIGWECKDSSLEFQLSHKAGSQNFSGEPLIQHTTDVCLTAIDYGELARDQEAISENATRNIFSWLRSDGYAPRERDIWDHEWFNMPESDEDDIGDDVDDNTAFGTSTRLSLRVESWILDAKASTSDSEASGTHTLVTPHHARGTEGLRPGNSLGPFPVDDPYDIERVIDEDMVTLIVRVLEEELTTSWDVFPEAANDIQPKTMDKISVYRTEGINLSTGYHFEVGLKYCL